MSRTAPIKWAVYEFGTNRKLGQVERRGNEFIAWTVAGDVVGSRFPTLQDAKRAIAQATKAQ